MLLRHGVDLSERHCVAPLTALELSGGNRIAARKPDDFIRLYSAFKSGAEASRSAAGYSLNQLAVWCCSGGTTMPCPVNVAAGYI